MHSSLKLSVLRAYNLKDSHIIGKNHPYLKVFLDGVEQQVINQDQHQVDPSKADDPVNPEFGSEYELPMHVLEKEVHIEVWGRELLIDSKLGAAVVTFNDLITQANEQGSKSIKAYSLFSEKHANEVVGAVEIGAVFDTPQARVLQSSLTSQTKESTSDSSSIAAVKLGTDDKHAGHVTDEMRPINVPLSLLPIRVGLVLPAEHKEQSKALESDPNFIAKRVGGLTEADEKELELEKRFQRLKASDVPTAVGEVDIAPETRPIIVQPVMDEGLAHSVTSTLPLSSTTDNVGKHSTTEAYKGPVSNLPGEEIPLLVQPVVQDASIDIDTSSTTTTKSVEQSTNEIDQAASEKPKLHSNLPGEEVPLIVHPAVVDTPIDTSSKVEKIEEVEKPKADESMDASASIQKDTSMDTQDKITFGTNQDISAPYEFGNKDLSQAKTDSDEKDVVTKDDIQTEKQDMDVAPMDNKDLKLEDNKDLKQEDSKDTSIQTSVSKAKEEEYDESQEYDEQQEDFEGNEEEEEDQTESFDPAKYEEEVGKRALEQFKADEEARLKSAEQADITNQREEVGGTAAAAIPAVPADIQEKPKKNRRRRHRGKKHHTTKVEQDTTPSDQPQANRELWSDKLK